ncbi:MAG: alpha/beta hydrolase family protein [Lachnospiraceae bacterium]|nr:alpha/beta hydrolase family protein [Lachnospiraceae bacterium]
MGLERIEPVKKYYTCRGALEKRMADCGRKEVFSADTIEDFTKWKQELREILSKLIGLPNMTPCPPDSEVMERVELEDGIVREKVILEVEDGVWMPFYILIPPCVQEVPVQCFLALPGHMGGGKNSIAGRREIPAIRDVIERFHYDYGMQLARLGYVAFCPDNRGFGERREEALQADTEEAYLNSTCFHLAHMAEPLGQTVIGMCTWDVMRLIDYIQARGEWNCDRVGCVGFSGGGMQTLWAGAMDDRIGISIISGYLYGYRDSLLVLNGNCSCNYVPGLWLHADMGDIAALHAPGPLLVQSCREDDLNGRRGLANVYEQMDTVRAAYRLWSAEEFLTHDIRPGGHCWHPECLEPFLRHAQGAFRKKTNME